jgi:hypothetical protein
MGWSTARLTNGTRWQPNSRRWNGSMQGQASEGLEGELAQGRKDASLCRTTAARFQKLARTAGDALNLVPRHLPRLPRDKALGTARRCGFTGGARGWQCRSWRPPGSKAPTVRRYQVFTRLPGDAYREGLDPASSERLAGVPPRHRAHGRETYGGHGTGKDSRR